jgi:hypothetical protein
MRKASHSTCPRLVSAGGCLFSAFPGLREVDLTAKKQFYNSMDLLKKNQKEFTKCKNRL